MWCSETWSYACFKPVYLWVFLSSKVIHMKEGPTVSGVLHSCLRNHHECIIAALSKKWVSASFYTQAIKEIFGKKEKKIQWFCKNSRGWWHTWKPSCMRIGGFLNASVWIRLKQNAEKLCFLCNCCKPQGGGGHHIGLILSPEFLMSLPQFCYSFLIRMNSKLHSCPTQTTFESGGGQY